MFLRVDMSPRRGAAYRIRVPWRRDGSVMPEQGECAMGDGSERQVLWECDQCAYREWRPADQEPWLCVVCGYERWQEVREHTIRDDVPDPGGAPGH